MGTSLDSSRPILGSTNNRYSIMSNTPTVATAHTSLSTASAQQEIKDIEDGLQKLDNKKLGAQRFIPSKEKTEHLQAVALGAKLERALGRRMGGQDAVMRERKPAAQNEKVQNEKVALAA